MPVSRLLPSAAIAMLLALVSILVIDQPLARFIATRDTMPELWNEGIRLLEYPFGIEPYLWPSITTGVAFLAAGTVLTLVVPRLRPAAFVFTLVTLVHFVDRNLVNWLKLAFGRLRPYEWLKAGGDVETFWHHNKWGFPSGHAILFSSILVPLAVAYPRTRPLLVILAFVFTARVMVNAHFVSDVLAGYAVVALTTWACVRLLLRVRSLPSPPAFRE